MSPRDSVSAGKAERRIICFVQPGDRGAQSHYKTVSMDAWRRLKWQLYELLKDEGCAASIDKVTSDQHNSQREKKIGVISAFSFQTQQDFCGIRLF